MTSISKQGARAARPRTLLRGALAVLVLVAALAMAAWAGRALLLRSAAEWWIVSDQVARADAVAIFGGGLDTRPFAAAAYYREGLVKKIALSNIRPSPVERLGVFQSHVQSNRKVLLALGVPESAIETFGVDVSNTYEEAVALRDWAARGGVRSIIVPTENFSARRVRWILQRVFADAATISVPALDDGEYRSDTWWRHERGMLGFQNEVIKYLYYRHKY